jgi:hypothetical protein
MFFAFLYSAVDRLDSVGFFADAVDATLATCP